MAEQGKLYVGYDGTGLFKIGITRNAHKRKQQIRTGNPTFQFLFVFDVENPAVAEVECHTKFNSRRVAGEWFSLTADDIRWIYNRFDGTPTKDLFDKLHDALVNKRIAADKGFIDYSDKRSREEGWY